METMGFLLGLYISNFILTYVLRCHTINKNIEDFRVMAKRLNFPDDLREYMENSLDKTPEWYDYIPGVNIVLALKDWITRKKDMELLEDDIKHFESEYGPVEQFVGNSSQSNIKTEKEYHEYFVGYFLEGRPIVIYFLYDGDIDIIISNDSAPTFNALDDQTKVDILMKVLYNIYIGSREYIRCSSIIEVFTESMIETLVNTFESDSLGYEFAKEPERDLIRRKPK